MTKKTVSYTYRDKDYVLTINSNVVKIDNKKHILKHPVLVHEGELVVHYELVHDYMKITFLLDRGDNGLWVPREESVWTVKR